MNVVLCSVATNPTHPGVKRWQSSAKDCGFEMVHVLGGGVGDGKTITWQNTGTKLQLFLQVLRSMKRNDIFIGTDCYDVICQGDRDSLVRLFLESGARVILSTETGGDGNKTTHYPPLQDVFGNKTKYRHENGGFVMGYPKDVIDMFEWSLQHCDEGKTHRTADQYGLGWYFVHNANTFRDNDKLLLDTTQAFCGVLVGREYYSDWKWRNGRLEQTEFQTTPAFLHVPGVQKWEKLLVYNTIGWKRWGWKRMLPDHKKSAKQNEHKTPHSST